MAPRFWPNVLRLRRVPLAAPALSLFALTACAEHYPQTTLHPKADFARLVDHLFQTTFWWAVVVFVLVEGALLLAVVRFRGKPGDPEPTQVHGSSQLEVIWTVLPALILTMIAVPTVETIFRTSVTPAAPEVEVEVIGHQWWWEFRYPQLGVVTANEMHVPVQKMIGLKMWSADVIHSFWFPAVAGKRDAVPGRTNHIWFTADSLGTFPGQCAEFCGMSHANMRMKLFVETPKAFGAWVAAQQGPPAEPESTSLAGEGKRIFSTAACIACHTVNGVSAGIVGPNLTHIGSRTTLAGGVFPNTPGEMAKWIADAPGRKPGAIMFPLAQLGITAEQIPAVVAYLETLK